MVSDHHGPLVSCILCLHLLPRQADVGLDGPSAHDVRRERLRAEVAGVAVAEGRRGEEQGGQEAQSGARPHGAHALALPESEWAFT